MLILKFIIKTWYLGILIVYIGLFFGQIVSYAQAILNFSGGLYYNNKVPSTVCIKSVTFDRTQKNVYVYYIDVALTDRLSSPSL